MIFQTLVRLVESMFSINKAINNVHIHSTAFTGYLVVAALSLMYRAFFMLRT